jgi:hypothetical protein
METHGSKSTNCIECCKICHGKNYGQGTTLDTFSWRPALNGKQLLVKSLAYAFVKRISLLIPKQAIARSKSFYFKANANAK